MACYTIVVVFSHSYFLYLWHQQCFLCLQKILHARAFTSLVVLLSMASMWRNWVTFIMLCFSFCCHFNFPVTPIYTWESACTSPSLILTKACGILRVKECSMQHPMAQPGEVLPSHAPSSSSLSSKLAESTSFKLSLCDEDMKFGCQSDAEKLWKDVQSLVQESFESLEGHFLDLSHRMEQIEQKMINLQTVVDEHLLKSPSSSNSSRASEPGSSWKWKRKTLTLQVQFKT